MHKPQKSSPPIDSFQDEYRFLSNFWPSPVDYMGDYYPTVEHAFQAMKTMKAEERTEILKAKTPGEAKRLGRKVTLREDWEERKMGVMEHFVLPVFLSGYGARSPGQRLDRSNSSF